MVLFDPSVVVGLEERHGSILEEGVGFEVESRAVYVGDGDANSFRDRPSAFRAHDDVLVAVDLVEFGTSFRDLSADVFFITPLLEDREDVVDDLALRLVGKESLVALGELVRRLEDVAFGLGDALAVHEELFGQLLALGLLCHGTGHRFTDTYDVSRVEQRIAIAQASVCPGA